MMWVLVLVLVPALQGLSSAMVCPDGDLCESGNTCCENPEGDYVCCPLPRADCCSDHRHCCYEGTVCDLVQGRCVNRTVSLPWRTRRRPPHRAPLLPQELKAVVCPDGESECPDDTTCCQLADGSWGCCQFAKAVCCEDKRHCCPEGTTCDLEHSKCVSSSLESFPMLAKEPARKSGNHSTPPVASVSCPGGQSSCPDKYTCCFLSSGAYGCCPYAQAVCCSDHLHCCPSDTVCDLEHEVCSSGAPSAAPLKRIATAAVECPDKKSTCPDETTCCKMDDDTYGCCPMPNAVCCSDLLHCCPEGTDCDVAHGACVSSRRETAMMAAMMPAAVATLEKVGAVPCNGSVACADGNSCCTLPNGGWACCPLPTAVCCDDHLHCCPHGTVCNLEASTCDDASGAAAPWSAKVPAFPSLAGNGKCDKSTSCPEKSTCCKTEGGGWACCPLPQAVCCDDHEHCCPHATVCNLPAETCDDPTGFLPPVRWLEKTPAVTSETCDERTACRSGTTCCKKRSGQWACCPVPQAVCCDDHEHCCPGGYACNVAARSCIKPGALDLPWLHKVPALQRGPGPARPDRNMCDAQTSCPRGTTCCFMAGTRRWGCCPLPRAVCCEDGLHCCPGGHACEPHRAACSKGPHVVVPWFSKLSATNEPAAVTDVKCDDKSSCASGTTCCKLQTGEWGCCPLVKAVCCADREHCCPQGYTCNMQTGTCEKTSPDALHLPVPQIQVVRPDAGDKPCGVTGAFHCSKQDTCCRVSASEWACCPSPKAVCCPDSKHCCPAGYSCDPAEGCSQRSQRSQLTWDALTGDRRRDLGL